VIVLDTNVISALMHEAPDVTVTTWLDPIARDAIWITTISIFEIRYGIEQLAVGRRRKRLDEAFDVILEAGFPNRVLSLDARAATAAASIAAGRKRAGRPAEFRDTLIAGIVVSRRAELATRNVRHYDDLDIKVINPWTI
jgi:predicted nucleic acid-binding protein